MLTWSRALLCCTELSQRFSFLHNALTAHGLPLPHNPARWTVGSNGYIRSTVSLFDGARFLSSLRLFRLNHSFACCGLSAAAVFVIAHDEHGCPCSAGCGPQGSEEAIVAARYKDLRSRTSQAALRVFERQCLTGRHKVSATLTDRGHPIRLRFTTDPQDNLWPW
jgi:hypothetical protein